MPLDIGVGILLALGVSAWFGVPLDVFLIVFGVGSTLLPDIDVPLSYVWSTVFRHRSFVHYPIIYVSLIPVVYVLLGKVYLTLFILGVLSHFVHDTIGIGWGIAWFQPFSPRKFLFPNKTRRKVHGWFMTWLPAEEGALVRAYEDPHWIHTFYFRPNAIAFVEYGVLMGALGVLLWVMR